MTYGEYWELAENGTPGEKEKALIAIENRFFYWSSCALDFPGYTKER